MSCRSGVRTASPKLAEPPFAEEAAVALAGGRRGEGLVRVPAAAEKGIVSAVGIRPSREKTVRIGDLRRQLIVLLGILVRIDVCGVSEDRGQCLPDVRRVAQLRRIFVDGFLHRHRIGGIGRPIREGPRARS